MTIYLPPSVDHAWLEGGYNGGLHYVTNGRENGPLCATAEEAVEGWNAVVWPNYTEFRTSHNHGNKS